jgi:cytochrome c oxidase assembly protein subunit 15
MSSRIKAWGWRGAVKALAVAASVGMFAVLVMGTVVTNTNSAQGCGRDWPLCRGRFIPEFAVATFIEFSHRAVTGVEGILIVALAVGALVYWRQRRELQVLVPLMLAFLVIQAVLGGLAVKYPETPAVLAAHFGISLIAFASVLLVTAVVWEAGGADALRDRPLPRGFVWSTWGLIVFTYLVVYIGAYVRHKGISLACPDWPLCQGAVVPQLAGATGFARGIVLLHRYSAALLVAGTVALLLWARRLRRGRPDLYRGSLAALILLGGQALAGAWVVASRLSLFSTLGHAALVALYFGALSYLCLHTLARPAAFRRALVRRAAPAAPRPAVSAPVAQVAERD